MMHITEDTPPDMLAGAMDLTVHLPTGRSVKMSVERSTPMMDLLVQIVTAHQLQLSGHILEALEMAPATGISDKVLPYKPNTPIGALDTQHIRVVPKNKSIPVPKSVPSGHQPFESTFRLKVHLPRNQLYVTRVSQNVYLEDIMKKVCKEKDLDPVKYEFRHPGNLDEVLDPKLTLSDYQITEIYVVSKGSGRLTQAFSTSDIMALRKEEERKQFQAKTGGGVFNLIFKRGKPNPGNGSISSDNRSISPTHSDDSRSVTPPGIQPPQIIKEPPGERPKPPQRKRRPAPKPPQAPPEEVIVEKPASQISNTSNQSDTNAKRPENGLIICHSRNSSDSSGYHEASILSDNCNTSLPRRPRTMVENDDGNVAKLSGEHSRSTGNLTKTSLQYKSTSSLALHGRKKKAAPPPPPQTAAPKPETSNIKLETTSPVVASQPVENLPASLPVEGSMNTNTTPLPAPRRTKLAHATITNRPSKEKILTEPSQEDLPRRNDEYIDQDSNIETPRSSIVERIDTRSEILDENHNISQDLDTTSTDNHKPRLVEIKPYSRTHSDVNIAEKIKTSDVTPNNTEPDLDLIETSLSLQSDINPYLENIDLFHASNYYVDVPKSPTSLLTEDSYLSDSRRKSCGSIESDFSITSTNSKGSKPEIVGVIPKRRKQSNFDTLSRKRGFQIGSSLISMETEDDVFSNTSITSEDKSLGHISLSSKTSDYSTNANDYEMNDINEDIFKKSPPKRKKERQVKERHINDLLGVNEYDLEYDKNDDAVKDRSITSLKSMDSIPGFMRGGSMKKWRNSQDLDDISLMSGSSLPVRSKWIVGDYSDTESVSTVPTNQTPTESISSSALPASTTPSTSASPRTSLSNANSPNGDKNPEPSKKAAVTPPPTPEHIDKATTDPIKQTETDLSVILSESKNEADSGICEKEDLELDTVWQYRLPSPPKAFRDASPVVTTTVSHYDTETLPDSVVTNPELFEKLQYVKDIQDAESDIPSVVSDDDKEICNKLTLEHLEKRKSLVYNRELATSLKFAQENDRSETSENKNYDTIASKVIQELEDVISTSSTTTNSTESKVKEVTKSAKAATLEKNLPNFQISSYDTKKEKINIFEDDTIRSNVTRSNSNIKSTKPEISIRNNIPNKTEIPSAPSIENNTPKRANSISESEEKHSEEVFKKPVEISTYRLKNSFYERNKNVNNNSVNRSGSFSMNSENWTPSAPVKRSKSQIALNKYKEDNSNAADRTENLSRSNSLLDVSSSLQSLEVIKKIQNKLSNSKEELDAISKNVPPTPVQEHVTPVEEKPAPPPKPTSTATHISWSPPSVNLSSWSQRPKTQVMVKEDTDYKFSTNVTTSSSPNDDIDARQSTTLRATPSFSSYNRPSSVNLSNSQHTSNGVSIKVNGSEAISSQTSGNVVIKIGGSDTSKELDTNASRFINHITPEGYRKPFGNVNKIERTRPHSIAFDNQFDISRVPVVRSVELKKPFKDLQNNKSITQIYSNSMNVSEDEPKSLSYTSTYAHDTELKNEKKHTNIYLSNESLNKPVFRNNSFTPVVKGFRTDSNPLINRKIWGAYGTLPSKPTGDNQAESNITRNVPFTQMNLRRTESNKVFSNNATVGNSFGNVVLRNNNNNNFKTTIKTNNEKVFDKIASPPPPPQLPKENAARPKSADPADARAELLSAIRNFGGKNGLRASKG